MPPLQKSRLRNKSKQNPEKISGRSATTVAGESLSERNLLNERTPRFSIH